MDPVRLANLDMYNQKSHCFHPLGCSSERGIPIVQRRSQVLRLFIMIGCSQKADTAMATPTRNAIYLKRKAEEKSQKDKSHQASSVRSNTKHRDWIHI
ncbi:Mitochondrial import inner membrane translocase subunit Tim17, partial [Musa troglodytarum]